MLEVLGQEYIYKEGRTTGQKINTSFGTNPLLLIVQGNLD